MVLWTFQKDWPVMRPFFFLNSCLKVVLLFNWHIWLFQESTRSNKTAYCKQLSVYTESPLALSLVRCWIILFSFFFRLVSLFGWLYHGSGKLMSILQATFYFLSPRCVHIEIDRFQGHTGRQTGKTRQRTTVEDKPTYVYYNTHYSMILAGFALTSNQASKPTNLRARGSEETDRQTTTCCFLSFRSILSLSLRFLNQLLPRAIHKGSIISNGKCNNQGRTDGRTSARGRKDNELKDEGDRERNLVKEWVR